MTLINLSPNDCKAWVMIGIVYEDLGRFNESLQSYNQAIEVRFLQIPMAIMIKPGCIKRGNNTDAMTNANRAIDLLNSSLASALDTKGGDIGRYGKERRRPWVLHRAIELDPS